MTFKDHFSGHADIYAAFRPDYPDGLFEYLAQSCQSTSLAWDCATGNGQAAKALQPYFEKVIATDASETQIANARPCDGVVYRVANADDSGLESESVDLITVAQAIHWFDFDAFFKEAHRVLKPSGILAVWGYGLAKSGLPLDDVVSDFYEREVGSFWPPERHFVEKQYKTIPFPYPQAQAPLFKMKTKRTRDQLLGYLRSWSASKLYEAQFGFDPVTLIEGQIQAAWPEDAELLTFATSLFLYMGRKAG